MRRRRRLLATLIACCLSGALAGPAVASPPQLDDVDPAVAGTWIHTALTAFPDPDGQERTYWLRLPAGSWSGSRPAIVYLPGVNLSPVASIDYDRLTSLADREGIVLIGGEGWKQSFAADGCCGPAAGDDGPIGEPEATQTDLVGRQDDVAYVSAIIGAGRRQAHGLGMTVAPNHVTVMGFSNGGMLAALWACAIGPTAVAVSVAGPLLVPCTHRVHLLHVHGIYDISVPFYGGPSTYTHTDFPDSNQERLLIPERSSYALWARPFGHSWGPTGGHFQLDLEIWAWIQHQHV